MIVVVPSMIIAAFAYELGPILTFCGFFSLIIIGIVIPVASLAAERIIPTKSEFDFKCNTEVAWGIIIISSVIFISAITKEIISLS